MSRSRKRPSYSDYSRSYTKWAKRQASKAVRRYQGELTDGGLYKKVFPTWNIFDYKGLWFEVGIGHEVLNVPDEASRK